MSSGAFLLYLNPIFFLKYASPKNLLPDVEVESVNDIDMESLKKRGIRAIIFDVDNTVCAFHGLGINERLEGKVKELCNYFSCCLLSNTPSSKRMDELKKYFTLPVIETPVRKPEKGAFITALKFLGTTPSDTAMVGDRLLTDIAGANNMGLLSIRVKPLYPKTEPWGLRIVRVAESVLLALYKII